MELNKALFWDVDYQSIDFVKNANWVIVRVFERGDVEDIRAVRRYYGDKKVREALLSSKYIKANRLHLAAAVINEPVEKFRCYILQQSNPIHLPY
jgi:hypothetical protein